jgi:hypothetical protein
MSVSGHLLYYGARKDRSRARARVPVRPARSYKGNYVVGSQVHVVKTVFAGATAALLAQREYALVASGIIS